MRRSLIISNKNLIRIANNTGLARYLRVMPLSDGKNTLYKIFSGEVEYAKHESEVVEEGYNGEVLSTEQSINDAAASADIPAVAGVAAGASTNDITATVNDESVTATNTAGSTTTTTTTTTATTTVTTTATTTTTTSTITSHDFSSPTPAPISAYSRRKVVRMAKVKKVKAKAIADLIEALLGAYYVHSKCCAMAHEC
jgi:dsRNA-specific ribonuclease